MTFALKKKTSSRTIRSPRRRGAPAGIRTLDTRLKRAVLYLLSYWGIYSVRSSKLFPIPTLSGFAGAVLSLAAKRRLRRLRLDTPGCGPVYLLSYWGIYSVRSYLLFPIPTFSGFAGAVLSLAAKRRLRRLRLDTPGCGPVYLLSYRGIYSVRSWPARRQIPGVGSRFFNRDPQRRVHD